MDSDKIQELLTRYWNCETSLEEEQQLHTYFQGGQIPDNLKDTAALFKYFEVQKKKSVSDTQFDERVLAKTTSKGGRIHFLPGALRIAAGVIVLMVSVWLIHSEMGNNSTQQVEDTYTDPQQAFEETKKALLMISKNFDVAQEQVKKIDLFNEATEKVKAETHEEKKEKQL